MRLSRFEPFAAALACDSRRDWRSLCFAIAVCLPAGFGLVPASEAAVDFEMQIVPILQAHCVRCHSTNNRQGELSLTSGDDLQAHGFIAAGNPAGSYLLEVVSSVNGEPPLMPQEGPPLSSEEVDLLRAWIADGADWPADVVVRERSRANANWWSLQPVQPVEPPEVADAPEEWRVNPIDRFVYARLAAEGWTPSPPADRRTLIRRASFDVIGLPPVPEEVEQFVSDPDPAAYERLVDRLLDSPHFGERWARHWLDIAHYADTHGFERDKRRDQAWRYRDYVIRAFNADKPYDEFLQEQIAGDVIAPGDADAVVATGFLAAGPWDFVGQVETKSPMLRRAARALDLDDMLTQVMTATMGLTVNCARCHDHKLDPITQREYYQLTAVFAGLRRGDRDVSAEARREYDAERQRLENESRRLGVAVGALAGVAIDLADVVGGGSGFGSGTKGLGLDVRTGKGQVRPFGDLGNVQPGRFSPVSHELIDGVFVPTANETVVSSTGLKATDLPENGGQAWDMIRNGPVASQYSTQLGAVDYDSEGHSLLGLHANAGITFDLAAVRTSTGVRELRFSTVVGYGGRLEEPSAEFRVLLDGQLRAQGRIGRKDVVEVDLTIADTDRFLTLISTDGGNGYGHDQISFGDPQLQLVGRNEQSADVERELARLRAEQEVVAEALRSLGEPPAFYGVIAETPPAVQVLIRGNPETPADEVAPGTLGLGREGVTFGPADLPEGARRRALADWIIDEDNPLTARVVVNRLWHWHFGRGLVGTPSDFGYGGERPSHPELLDWLAGELVRANWSLKRIHRLILTSQTWRMTSRSDGTTQYESGRLSPAQRDADNRLLWRMNPRRLEAEVVRDSVLAVTGKLNPTMFGPGYRDFDYEEAYAPIYRYKTADVPELWRRTVYRFVVRTTPDRFLTTLDCPDPANLTPRRLTTTTPLQSLALYNNDFMLRQAGYLAERLRSECGEDPGRQVERGFVLAFGRAPTEGEAALGRRFIEQHGLHPFCRSLLNANEFVYVD